MPFKQIDPWTDGPPFPMDYETGKPLASINNFTLKPGEYLTFQQIQKAGAKIRKGEKAQTAYKERFGKYKEYKVFEISQLEKIQPKFDYSLLCDQQRIRCNIALDYIERYVNKHKITLDDIGNPFRESRSSYMQDLLKEVAQKADIAKGLPKRLQEICYELAGSQACKAFGIQGGTTSYLQTRNSSLAATRVDAFVEQISKGFSLQQSVGKDSPLSKFQLQADPIPAKNQIDEIRQAFREKDRQKDIRHAKLDYLPPDYVRWQGEIIHKDEMADIQRNTPILARTENMKGWDIYREQGQYVFVYEDQFLLRADAPTTWQIANAKMETLDFRPDSSLGAKEEEIKMDLAKEIYFLERKFGDLSVPNKEDIETILAHEANRRESIRKNKPLSNEQQTALERAGWSVETINKTTILEKLSSTGYSLRISFKEKPDENCIHQGYQKAVDKLYKDAEAKGQMRSVPRLKNIMKGEISDLEKMIQVNSKAVLPAMTNTHSEMEMAF